jgi:DNA-binding CsgD family transcriptional regulator
MPHPSSDVQKLREQLAGLLPPGGIYQPVVPADRQRKALELLDEEVSHERFYFVFNLQNCELEHVRGVERWLGYSGKEFTVSRYLGCIHPGQSIQLNLIAASMYRILCSGVFKLQFSTQRYISFVGLRHNKGEYTLFKKTTSVFQYDRENRLLAQLNVFDKIDDYEHSPLNPRITEIQGLQKEDFERAVFNMTLQQFMEKKYFSEREFAVLKLYSGNSGITTRELAEALKVQTTTINTYNKRILAKAKEIFTHPFNEAREVAFFLKKEKIC